MGFILFTLKSLIMKNLILEIQRRFEEALEAKTGWGKNDVKTLYNKIVIEVLSENLSN